MPFSPNPEQQALSEALRRYCATRGEHRQSPDETPRTWRQLADMGLLGTLVSERLGGAHGSVAEAAIVSEELGRALLPSAFLPAAVFAGHLLASCADAPAARQALERLIDGSGVTALVCGSGLAASTGFKATLLSGGDWDVGCTRALVPFVNRVDTIVLGVRSASGAAGCRGPTLFCVDSRTPGITIGNVTLLDGSPAVHIGCSEVHLDVRDLIASPEVSEARLRSAQSHALICACAEMVGVMESALSAVRSHLTTRRQYGATLSALQVLQHRFADMYAATELARAMLNHLIETLIHEPQSLTPQISTAACAYIAAKGHFVTTQSIQLHGAAGMTRDHRAGACFRRLHVLSSLSVRSEGNFQP